MVQSSGLARLLASSLRAARLLSRLTSFIKSTIDFRQSSLSGDCAARLSMIAATSTGAVGEPVGVAGAAAGAAEEVGGAPAGAVVGAAAADDERPNMADIMLPKTLIVTLRI